MNHSNNHHPEDKELIDRILRGDNQAYAVVIKNTEKLIAQIVFKLIPVAEDRKDLAQDIYLKAYNKLSSFRFQSKLSTWIAQIAYNTCISWRDKKKFTLPGNLHDEDRYGAVLPSDNAYTPSYRNAETELTQKELALILQKEIDGLPAVYQMLITLFHHESMSYDELSQMTGLPEGTVKSYLFRARKTLKDRLLVKYKKEAL